MKFMMVNCKEAARLLSDKLEYLLPLHKRILLRIHVAMCAACGFYGRQIKGLKDLLSRYPQKLDTPPSSAAPLSEDARQRMKELIRHNTPQ